MQEGNHMYTYRKQSFLSLCLILLLSISCISCGTRNNATVAAASVISLQDLTYKIEQAGGKLPKMDCYNTSSKDAEDWFHYLCDFDYSKVDDYYISYASNGSAEEIFLIKLKNSEDSTYAELSLHDRIKSRATTFDQYAPKEAAKLSHAVITSNGNYVALLICEDEYSAKKAFEDAFSTSR